MTDLVTIILTCYFEGELLRDQLPSLQTILNESGLSYELVIVVDGSDEATDQVLRGLLATTPGLRLVKNDLNIGRGGSVARGVHAAQGAIAGFIDPDMEILPEVIPLMVREIHRGADLVIADRRVTLAPSNAFRWTLSKCYRALANSALKLPNLDTESGCKFFRVDKVLPVIDTIENMRWFWDTELVARAVQQTLVVSQVPARFVRNANHPTTVRVVRDSLEYLRELRRLRRQLSAGGRGTDRRNT